MRSTDHQHFRCCDRRGVLRRHLGANRSLLVEITLFLRRLSQELMKVTFVDVLQIAGGQARNVSVQDPGRSLGSRLKC